MGREIFLWDDKNLLPRMKFILPNDPSAAADLPSDGHFIVGDVAGMIHLMAIRNSRPIRSAHPFQMHKVVPITALVAHAGLVFVGNRLGYVRFLELDGGSLIPSHLFRAHSDGIEMITVSEKAGFIVTSGRDNEICVWCIDPFAFIGLLGRHDKWRLDDRETWPTRSPCEIDPNDFAQVEEEQEAVPVPEVSRFAAAPQLDDDEILLDFDSKGSPDRPLTVPQPSEILSELEHVCLAGRKTEAIAQQLEKVRPDQAAQPEGDRLMTYEDLIPTPELEVTVRTLNRLRNLRFKKARH
jgi:hypothetical protein